MIKFKIIEMTEDNQVYNAIIAQDEQGNQIDVTKDTAESIYTVYRALTQWNIYFSHPDEPEIEHCIEMDDEEMLWLDNIRICEVNDIQAFEILSQGIMTITSDRTCWIALSNERAGVFGVSEIFHNDIVISY